MAAHKPRVEGDIPCPYKHLLLESLLSVETIWNPIQPVYFFSPHLFNQPCFYTNMDQGIITDYYCFLALASGAFPVD